MQARGEYANSTEKSPSDVTIHHLAQTQFKGVWIRPNSRGNRCWIDVCFSIFKKPDMTVILCFTPFGSISSFQQMYLCSPAHCVCIESPLKHTTLSNTYKMQVATQFADGASLIHQHHVLCVTIACIYSWQFFSYNLSQIKECRGHYLRIYSIPTALYIIDLKIPPKWNGTFAQFNCTALQSLPLYPIILYWIVTGQTVFIFAALNHPVNNNMYIESVSEWEIQHTTIYGHRRI